jgi:hypothetical protein
LKSPIVVIGWICVLLSAGCTTPAERLDRQAAELGLKQQWIQGTNYQHAVYLNAAWGQTGRLHIYLEGDGTPWLSRFIVAPDPTPRNPLMLRLMAQDETSSLYLGRPCYHGQADMAPCSPQMWTSRRYAEEVVESMATALRSALRRSHYSDLIFIGYSGGGTLAMLLAEQFTGTRGILTIAGNLDPQSWTDLHRYSPLQGSLNPALRPPLDAGVIQLHFAGGRDQNIPPKLIKPVIDGQHYAKLNVIKSYDHVCCWEASWLSILMKLEQRLKAAAMSPG